MMQVWAVSRVPATAIKARIAGLFGHARRCVTVCPLTRNKLCLFEKGNDL